MRSNMIYPCAGLRLFLCAVISVGALMLSGESSAWGPRAHRAIAERALEALPIEYSSQLSQYKDDLMRGASEKEADGPQSSANHQIRPSIASQIAPDIQLLMLIPHDAEMSHYFAFRLGEISSVVADSTLPFACSSSTETMLRADFERDIEQNIDTFQRFRPPTPVALTYPVSYLDRLANDARLSEGFVKTRYVAGDGYAACRDDIVLPAFKQAVEAVATIWFTILSCEPGWASTSMSGRVGHYSEQIRFSSQNGYLEDVYAALLALKREAKRIPLTPSFVGNEFFELPCGIMTHQIYELAASVDPQSSSISQLTRACDEATARRIEDEQRFKRRHVPRHLYGREGEEPDIYVYQHNSGRLLLTSKVKDVGPDYVLLNFEPIKKIRKEKVVKKVKGEPQVEEFDLEEIIRFYAKDYGISPALVKAVIKAESNFDPYVVSRAGARGLMQLMPSTAEEMNVDDIFDPRDNIGGGVQYLSRMLELFNNDLELSLAAYNAGPGTVLRYGGIPPFKETRQYVPRVLKYYEHYKNDPSPVKLRVALNKKPKADYLPEVEVVEEVEIVETISSPPIPEPTVSPGEVIVYLKSGYNMRGTAYEKTPTGIRLHRENGFIDIPHDRIKKIS
ncbi:MAG: hypothetical protein Kow0099_06250 [Candidatus Abyssubacteria bacterium]